MPYCDEKKVIFLHVPKTGGTAIKRLLGINLMNDTDPSVTPSPQHLTCKLLREKLGAEKYDGYFKFTFVRNPWARLVSDYFWRQSLPRKRTVLPFAQFIRHASKVVQEECYYSEEFGDHFIPQTQYTSDVDVVYRFEAFEAGVRAVAMKLNVTLDNITPKTPKAHDSYANFYDHRTRAIIADTYEVEINEFGYEFGG